jgi:hypothetical protein
MAAESNQQLLVNTVTDLGVDVAVARTLAEQFEPCGLYNKDCFPELIIYIKTLEPCKSRDTIDQAKYVNAQITSQLKLVLGEKDMLLIARQVQLLCGTLTKITRSVENIEDRVTNLVEKDELATTQARTVSDLLTDNKRLNRENTECRDIIAGYTRQGMTEKNDVDAHVRELEYQIQLITTQSSVFAHGLAESQRFLAVKGASYIRLERQYQETLQRERALSQKFQELNTKHDALTNAVKTGVLVGAIFDPPPQPQRVPERHRDPEPELQLESKVDDSTWKCTACTFENNHLLKICEICQQPHSK